MGAETLKKLFGETPQAAAGQQFSAPPVPGGMSMQSGNLGVSGVDTGRPLVSPEPQPFPQPPAWTNWGIPLINAAGAALSTPSAGGAGPIFGNALMAGGSTYEQMIQARQQAALAMRQREQIAQHQQAMEALAAERISESRGYHQGRLRAEDNPRPESPSVVKKNEAIAGYYDKGKPAKSGDAAENAQIRWANGQFNKFLQQLRVMTPSTVTDEELLHDDRVLAEAQRISAQSGVPVERILGISMQQESLTNSTQSGGSSTAPPVSGQTSTGAKFSIVPSAGASEAPTAQPTITPAQQDKRVQQQRDKGDKRQHLADVRGKKLSAEERKRRETPGHVGVYGKAE